MLKGKFCESVGLREDNFPARLYELDKEKLTNGLIREITMWARRTVNQRAGKYKTFHLAIIDLYNLQQDVRKRIPAVLSRLVKAGENKSPNRPCGKHVENFLRTPFCPRLPRVGDPPRVVRVAQRSPSSATIEPVVNPCCDVFKGRNVQLETEKNNLLKQNTRLQRQVEHFKVVAYKIETRMNGNLKRKQARCDLWRRKYIALLRQRNLEILKTRLRQSPDNEGYVLAKHTIGHVLKAT